MPCGATDCPATIESKGPTLWVLLPGARIQLSAIWGFPYWVGNWSTLPSTGVCLMSSQSTALHSLFQLRAPRPRFRQLGHPEPYHQEEAPTESTLCNHTHATGIVLDTVTVKNNSCSDSRKTRTVSGVVAILKSLYGIRIPSGTVPSPAPRAQLALDSLPPIPTCSGVV